jgi:Tfp pilus assembly protein PilF
VEGPLSRPVIRDEGIVPVAPAAAVTPREAAPARMAELSPDSLPEDYMVRARREYEAGRVREALAVLDRFRERFPLGSDEAWWLYGQVLEAGSPVRDIRAALDYYRRLVREYPQSPRYAAARQRIAYLERYYFNIR